MEGYVFDIRPRALDKFFRTIKELELELKWYLEVTYRDSCQPTIMTKTPETFPDLDITTIVMYTGDERTKTDTKMTYLKNNNIDDAIHQKLRKRDKYETDMYDIYNLIVGQTNEQIQEKVVSDATYKEVKASQYPIGYLNILKKLCL